MVMLGASTIAHQRRLWTLLGRPELIKRSNPEREADFEREETALIDIMLTRTATEWEEYLQANHIPAARIRTMGEALADPHLASRGLLHRHQGATGVDGEFSVPLAAFKFAHGGPEINTPPPGLGEHTDTVLAELGYTTDDVKRLRAEGII
jgi:crotonobetainyl-CoA:carnitine CoA-transferase CaiB-like acyl-CoA transferase